MVIIMKFCKQLFQDDCGFACLKMLLGYFKKDKAFLNLPNPKLQGKYSFLDLTNLGRKYGIELEGYKVNDLSLLNKNLPAIIEMCIEGQNHFCVLYKIKGNIFYVYDPSRGKIKLEIETFEKLFLNKVLICKNLINNNKNKIRNNIGKLFTSYIIVNIFINISCAFLIINNIKPNTMNFIALLLYICLIFIANKISLSFFDLIYEKRINEKIMLNEKINLNQFMNDIYLLKKSLFQNISTFVGNMITVFFILIICFLNNKYLLLCFLVLCFLNIIKFIISNKYSFSKIEHYENELKNKKSNRKENYVKLTKYVNIFKSKISLIDSLLIILEFFFVILLQLIEKTFVFNRALFFFFCLNLLTEKVYEIILFVSNKEEIQKDINKVNSFLDYN